MKKRLGQLVSIIFLLLFGLILFYGPLNNSAKALASIPTRGVRAVLFAASSSLKRNFSFIFRISDLRKENNDLAAKLTALQVDHNYTAELEIENQMLKKELGFLSAGEQGSLIPARIIQRDPIAFLDYIVIDKGETDGVEVRAAVLYGGVLVGQVSEIFPTTAKITLITSHDSMVQAMLQDERANGLLKGGISGLVLDNIVSDTEYKEGENVITSGLGGDIKQGILIGTAGKVVSDSAGIYKSIEVNPATDLSTLEMVFVQK